MKVVIFISRILTYCNRSVIVDSGCLLDSKNNIWDIGGRNCVFYPKLNIRGINLVDHMTALELLFISLPEAMLVTALGITLTGFTAHLYQLLLIGIFHTLVSYIIRGSQVPFGLHTIALLIIFIIIISVVTRLNFKTSALAGLVGLTIFAVVETLIALQLLNITGYTYQEVLADSVIRIYFFFPEAVVLTMIVLLCRRYDINILSYWRKRIKQTGELPMPSNQNDLNEDFFIKQYFPLISLVICPILLLALLNTAFFVYRTGSLTDKYLNFFTSFISLAVVVLTILSAVAIKRITKVVEAEFTAKQTAETLSRMKDLIYSIRKQRHDFNHHLQAVYGFLEVGSYREARDYIRNTFSVITTHGDLIKTDNNEISAMLYTKIGLAESRNINFEISISCSLRDLPFKSREANSVLGNLVDNAMDAVENANGERRYISLEIGRDPKDYIFTVANRGEPIKTDIIEQIFKPHFSTKKEGQGLGLAIVKEILERYHGTVTASSNRDETLFTVRIPSKR